MVLLLCCTKQLNLLSLWKQSYSVTTQLKLNLSAIIFTGYLTSQHFTFQSLLFSLSFETMQSNSNACFYLSFATFAALILFISSPMSCFAWISACRLAWSCKISCLSIFCDLLICHWFFSPYVNVNVNVNLNVTIERTNIHVLFT